MVNAVAWKVLPVRDGRRNYPGACLEVCAPPLGGPEYSGSSREKIKLSYPPRIQLPQLILWAVLSLVLLGRGTLVWGGWEQLGGSLNPDPNRNTGSPKIAVLLGVPYVVVSTGSIHVKYYSDSEKKWLQLGNTVNASINGSNPHIAFCGSTPFVAWIENNGTTRGTVYVKYYQDNQWIQAGNSLNCLADSNPYRVGITVCEGMPYVCWEETIQNAQQRYVYVKRWNGTAWEQAGECLNNLLSSTECSCPTLVTERYRAQPE